MNYFDREEWPGFLASIRANPADDLPRLVCADWLEENGEPERAEFVRVQVEIAKCETEAGHRISDHCHCLPCIRAKTLKSCENQLHWFGWREWGYPVSGFVSAGMPISNTLKFNRGFVSRVRAPLVILIGGECGRCRLWMENHDCPDCNGTGRTIGVLRELLRREPMGPEGIEVNDRGPSQNPDGSYSWWSLRRPGVVDREYILKHPRCGPFLPAPTESAARIALSRAVYAMCSG